MKYKITFLLLIVLLSCFPFEKTDAQIFSLSRSVQNIKFSRWAFGQIGHKQHPEELSGSVGMTWIDGEPYYLINLTPEFAFGKFGVGLDVNFRINKEGKIRNGEFSKMRFIRYLRWGQKGDDIYARVGILDYTRLGHGFIMYLYRNSPSYDDRRNGLEFDMNFGNYGFESVYGDFAQAGVFGIRGYTKPLKLTSASEIPILGEMEVGATIATDFRDDAVVDSNFNGQGSLGIFGLDVGFPILNSSSVKTTFYFDYAEILSYGKGAAIGIESEFHGLGIFDIFAKIERRFPGDKFLPNYFDSFYEIDRFERIHRLDTLHSPGPGIFGDMIIGILGTLQIRGAYQQFDDIPKSGFLHFETSSGAIIPVVIVDAGYDKKFVENFEDIFNLDERSLLYASFGYKPYPFMTVALVYTWTFARDKNGMYQPQKRVESRITFSYPINRGS
ncbi:MAG: hypothetical protein FJ218_02150 [Ignavibacteria bacterium]|nr:hypothetical protein [Ignavibacteria bacterium]